MKSFSLLSKITSAALAALLLAGSCASAFAAGRTPSGYITAETEFYNAHRDAVEHLIEGLYNMETSINMRDYDISVDDLGLLRDAAFESTPDLFFIEQGYSWNCSYNRNTGYINDVRPPYTYTRDQVEEYQGKFYLKADYFMSKISDGMTDLEKAVVLHDAICTNSVYNVEGGVYNLMVDGEGRCFGYAQVYAYLLALAGIKTEIVSGIGNGGSHQWLRVNLDGTYYNVDITFDDPLMNGVGDRMNYASHEYLLVSDDTINLDHSNYRTAYTCDDRYESLQIHDSHNPLVALNGKLYTVLNAAIVEYDINSDSAVAVKQLPTRWYTTGNAYYNANFSTIAQYGDLLYYNDQYSVYTFNPKTGETNVFANASDYSDSKTFYAMTIKGNSVYGLLESRYYQDTESVYLGEAVEPQILKGDANDDGKIDINDVTTIQKHVAKLIELDGERLRASDVNQDDIVNIMDATQVQKIIAKII